MDVGEGIVDRAVQVLEAMTGGEPLTRLETEASRQKHANRRKLLKEIARRTEMTDQDIQELRELVRDLDLSNDKSFSATGTSRLESTTRSSSIL